MLEDRTLPSVGLAHFSTFEGIDWMSAGVGGIGDHNGGEATIEITGISGTVQHAYLYWHGIDLPENGGDGAYDNETILFDGNEVTGVSLGTAPAADWGRHLTQAFRADVTPYVTANSLYSLGGLAGKVGHSANGASLIVMFDDGDSRNDRWVTIFDGNWMSKGETRWQFASGYLPFAGGQSRAQLHVSDGQSATEANLRFLASEYHDPPLSGKPTPLLGDNLFAGTTVPDMGHSRASTGSLWDIRTFDLSELFPDRSGLFNVFVEQDARTPNDDVGLIALVYETEYFGPQLTVTRSRDVSERAGPNAATGSVARWATDTSADLLVTLESSDESEVRVPETVVIPAGAKSVDFPIDAVDDALLDGEHMLRITAAAPGLISGAVDIRVFDYETLSVSLSRAVIAEDEGPAASTGTVTRSDVDNLGQDLLVRLVTPTPTGEVDFPEWVLIPAGEASATFHIHPILDGVLDGSQTVQFRATARGYVSNGALLTVNDADDPLLVGPRLTVVLQRLAAPENVGASTVLATVYRRNASHEESLTVQLHSSDPTEATVPARITFNYGEASRRFFVNIVDDALLDGPQTVTITATAEGFHYGADTVAIVPPGIDWGSWGTYGLLTANQMSAGTAVDAPALRVLPDGRVLAASAARTASSGWVLYRYNANGSYDTAVGPQGHVITKFPLSTGSAANAIAVQPDGKVLVAGTVRAAGGIEDWGIVRYHAHNLSLDTGFGVDGFLRLQFGEQEGQGGRAYEIASLPDGKFLVAGVRFGPEMGFTLARFTSSGALDLSFGNGGLATAGFNPVLTESVRAMVVQPDGRILLAGSEGTSSFAVARFTPEGNLDPTFGGGDGMHTFGFGTPYAQATRMELQSDGRIVIVGSAGVLAAPGGSENIDMAVARLNPDGTLDRNFSSDGRDTVDVFGRNDSGRGLTIQADGKIIIGGSAFDSTSTWKSALLVRYTERGARDSTFGTNGIRHLTQLHGPPEVLDLKWHPDGRIVSLEDMGINGDYISRYQIGVPGPSDLLTVTDYETLTISSDPEYFYDFDGLAAATLTVARSNTDVSEPLTVSLTKHASGRITFPESVTIPANERSVYFSVDTIPTDNLRAYYAMPVSLTAPGYTQIPQSLQIRDAAFLDDGSSSFATTGTWSRASDQGHDGDVTFAAPGDGSQTATWTLPVGRGVYRVWATWSPHANRATNALYTIYNGSVPQKAVRVNQQFPPDDLKHAGTWEQLGGDFFITADRLSIVLSNDADGYVIADTIRIEWISEFLREREIVAAIDRTPLEDGVSVVNFGTTAVGVPLSRTFTVQSVGPVLTVQPVVVPPGFTVTSNLSSNQSLPSGATATFTVRLNATTAGVYEGLLSFANNDADENPFNITITGEVVNPANLPKILDDGAAGFTTTGTWGTATGQGRDGDLRFAAPGDGSSTATWNFDVVPGLYRVWATWAQDPNRATDAPYTIYDNGTPVLTVRANQELPPNDLTADGSPWEALGGVYSIVGNSLAVVLSNNADEYVIADGVRIQRIGNLPSGPEVALTLDGSTVLASGTSSVAFGNTMPGFPVSHTFTVRNEGQTDLSLQPVDVPAGFTVLSNFSPGQVLAPGATASFTVRLEANTAGSFGGTLSFASSDADENPFTVDISGAVVGFDIIDDGDPGFSLNGRWNLATGQGYQGDVRFIGAGDGSRTASWTFEVVPGQYQVWATWSPHSNRATNAPYTVYNGSAPQGTVRLDQKATPNDLNDSGAAWEELGGIYQITSGLLTVVLSNDADQFVVADAIRIGYVGALPIGPEITVTVDGSTPLEDGVSTVEFGSTAVGTPLSRTFTVQNVGTTGLTLDPVSVPDGFTVTPNLSAGQTLAPGATATFTVRLDAAATGAYEGTLSFVNNDADENPFNVTITGQVVAAANLPTIIDDGDPGFTTVGTWGTALDQGRGSDVRFAAAGDGSAQAVWTFSVAPGQYRVWATWSQESNRATDAPYTVYDGDTALATVRLNQERPPNDLKADGSRWEEFGAVYSITGGVLRIVLSNDANEYVIADALRIERIGDLPGGTAPAGFQSSALSASTSTFDVQSSDGSLTSTEEPALLDGGSDDWLKANSGFVLLEDEESAESPAGSKKGVTSSAAPVATDLDRLFQPGELDALLGELLEPATGSKVASGSRSKTK